MPALVFESKLFRSVAKCSAVSIDGAKTALFSSLCGQAFLDHEDQGDILKACCTVANPDEDAVKIGVEDERVQ